MKKIITLDLEEIKRQARIDGLCFSGEETWKPIPGYEGIYDASNLGRIRSLERRAWNGKSFHALRGRIVKQMINKRNGYKCVGLWFCGKRKTKKVHRLVIETFFGHSDLDVDHVNREKKDNRIANLRYATRTQNNANSKQNRKGGTSKYKGVIWSKRDKKWLARAIKNGKQYHLGLFDLEENAARSYNKKAVELFGEFSNINILNPQKI